MLHPSEAPFVQLLQRAGMRMLELHFASVQASLCPGGTSSRDMYLMELALQRMFEQLVRRPRPNRGPAEAAETGARKTTLPARRIAAHALGR